MNSADLQDIRLGNGSGTRGSTCDICTEVMRDSDATATHISCENTFHTTCFDDWTETNHRQGSSTTCPKCRATLSRPDPLSAFFAGNSSDITPHFPVYPPDLRSFAERPVTTAESEMYDYTQVEASPGPALLDLFDTQRERARNWIGDYFVRLSRAQNLTNNEALIRLLDMWSRMGTSSVTHEQIVAFLGDIAPEEVATDLEIIDQMGRRRPRLSIVNFFENEPHEARDWLDARMTHTQRELGLDLDLMHQFREEFLTDVRRELRARQQAP